MNDDLCKQVFGPDHPPVIDFASAILGGDPPSPDVLDAARAAWVKEQEKFNISVQGKTSFLHILNFAAKQDQVVRRDLLHTALVHLAPVDEDQFPKVKDIYGAHPEFVAYREKVVATGRLLTGGEVAFMKHFRSTDNVSRFCQEFRSLQGEDALALRARTIEELSKSWSQRVREEGSHA